MFGFNLQAPQKVVMFGGSVILALSAPAISQAQSNQYNETTSYTISKTFTGGFTSETIEVIDPNTQQKQVEFQVVVDPFTKFTRGKDSHGSYLKLRKSPNASIVNSMITWAYYGCPIGFTGSYVSWLPGDKCEDKLGNPVTPRVYHRVTSYYWGGKGNLRFIDTRNLRVLEYASVEMYNTDKPAPNWTPCSESEPCKGGSMKSTKK